jgi:CRP-like cAMP-binding protein
VARDVRKLREEANEATASGKYKRALTAYLELERLEPNDAQWSKRVAETYRRLGKDRDAIDAFARAVERYAQGGFLVQAIAVCKLILQIDPKNDDALRRIASINEQIGAGPSRAVVLAQLNPELEGSAAVQHLKTQGTGTHPSLAERRKKVSSAPPTTVPRTITPQQLRARTNTPSDPPLAMARTKSKPITLPPGKPLDAVSLAEQVEASFEREEKSGVYVIPLGDDDDQLPVEVAADDDAGPPVEVEAPDEGSLEMAPVEVEEQTELDLEDLEEIPLPEPRVLGIAAAEALAATPLFAGLPHEALESLVERLNLVQLSPQEILFHEGDPGDALYVIVEGELSVQAEGPPRVEMARLGAGSFIGEVALMTDQPRSATVIALTDTELLRIDRPTLSHVLATHGEVLAAVLRFVRDRLVDRWTRTSPLFRPFGDEERAQLASRFKFLEVQPGATLLGANTRPDGLYIVLAGHFHVKRGGQQVAVLGPGEMLGEAALLSGVVFKSDVVARGKSLALCLPAADFRELIMTHPHVLEFIGEQAEHSRKLQIL